MEQRLTARLNKVEKTLDGHSKQFIMLTTRLDTLEENLTGHIDALEEDIVATIKDSLIIRKFVGMPLPDEE